MLDLLERVELIRLRGLRNRDELDLVSTAASESVRLDPELREALVQRARVRSALMAGLPSASMIELRVTLPEDVAERLASAAAERGTSAEELAADLLRQHVPSGRGRSLSFIGIFDGVAGAPSAAELERQLEDGEDPGFPP